jgi:hypothetical protein
MVPLALRQWLVLFFLCLVCAGVPLLLEPLDTIAFLGFAGSGSVGDRLLGASMLGIGAMSLIASRSHRTMVHTTVLLNAVWSGTSVFATVLLMEVTDVWGVWGFLLFFANACALWLYWLARLARANP